MREQARAICAWLDARAEFFVCGDKERMAADVDRELHAIVETQGGRTPDQAKEYGETMRKAKRYEQDVHWPARAATAPPDPRAASPRPRGCGRRTTRTV